VEKRAGIRRAFRISVWPAGSCGGVETSEGGPPWERLAAFAFGS
jgi:hypothetical protein